MRNSKLSTSKIPKNISLFNRTGLLHFAYLNSSSQSRRGSAYLYLCAGREGRAHPSIRHIAGTRKDCNSGCGVSKASICRALKVLERMKFFIKLFCQTVRGCLSCNSYLLTEMVRKEAATSKVAASCTVDPVCCSSFLGSLKIRTHLWINKITGDYTLREKEIGVPKFGRLYKLLDRISAFCTPLFSRFLRPPVKDSS